MHPHLSGVEQHFPTSVALSLSYPCTDSLLLHLDNQTICTHVLSGTGAIHALGVTSKCDAGARISPQQVSPAQVSK